MLEGDKVEGPCQLINEKEVEEAIKVMKAGDRRTIRGGGRNVESSWKERNKKVDRAMQPDGKRRGNSKRMGTQQGKGDPMECGSYRAVKLLEHGMKVLEGFWKRD